MSSPSAFGPLLRQLRKRAGMTQDDLAAAVGYSASYVCDLERNRRLPAIAVILQQFVLALGLQEEAGLAARLVELAALARGERPPSALTAERSTQLVLTETFPLSRSRLPSQPTELIGREHDVNALCTRVQGHSGRLLTLVGPPGVGKTRLGLAVAARLEPLFKDGARFIALAAVSDPELVANTIANELELPDTSKQSPLERLIQGLRRQELLLLLDNFEQVLAAVPLLAALLAECHGLHLLVTSRERLHLRAEQRFPVPPLDLDAAVSLFVQGAQAVDPAFEPSAAVLVTIQAICTRLDCLPLPIELIATRMDLLSPQRMLAELQEQGLAILVDTPRDLLAPLPPPEKLRRARHMRQILPNRLTSFVGRSSDVLSVAQLLRPARLVTLTGPGGCGKTSLAIETCRWLTSGSTASVQALQFDEIYLVELFPLTDPASLPQVVLGVLGLASQEDRTPLQTLVDAIDERSVVLLLDNCEHLIDAVALLVAALLQGCPNLRVLVTSRERLNIVAETVYTVAPLAYPDPQRLPALAALAEYGAIQLFVERSQAVAPEFHLTTENMAAVAQISAQLDAVPLALELGAAATATFSVQEIAARLDSHFPLAGPGYRAADPRHASVGHTVTWSYNLLTPAEQRLLAQLAVFAGGWTAAALEAVCAGEEDSLRILHQLVHKSLVRVEHDAQGNGHTRYHLLRAVREFAAVRLSESGEEELVRRRHFEYFAWLGRVLGDQVTGPEHRAGLAASETEHANVRAALAFGKRKRDLAEAYVRLAAALRHYWWFRGYVAECTAWLWEYLQSEPQLSLGAQAYAYIALLHELGSGFCSLGRTAAKDDSWPRLLDNANTLIARCLACGEEHAGALLMLGVAGLHEHCSTRISAEEYIYDAQRMLDKLGDVRGAGIACEMSMRMLMVQGRLDAAEQAYKDAVVYLQRNRMSWRAGLVHEVYAALAQQNQDRDAKIAALIRCADMGEQEQVGQMVHGAYWQLELTDCATAYRLAEEFLAHERRRPVSIMLGLALYQVGRMRLNAGRYAEAQAYLDEALQLWPRFDLSPREIFGIEWPLILRGEVAWYMGDEQLALACFEESIRLFASSAYAYYHMIPHIYRGHVRLACNDLNGAVDDLRSGLSVALDYAERELHFIVLALAGIGEVARRRGDIATAARLFAFAAAPNTTSRRHEEYMLPHELAHLHRVMDGVPQYCRDPAFEAAWQEGEKLMLAAVAGLALGN